MREGITFEDNRVTIPTKEGFLLKIQTMDRSPPPITFPSITTRHQLCPAFALSSYLEKSFHLPHGNAPFVHPKSGLPLLSGRLSYWIAKAISTFDSSNRGTAHDCRKVWSFLSIYQRRLAKNHSFSGLFDNYQRVHPQISHPCGRTHHSMYCWKIRGLVFY